MDINNDVFGVVYSKLDLRDKCVLGLVNKELNGMIYGGAPGPVRSSEYLVDDELESQATRCDVQLSFKQGDVERSDIMRLLFAKGCMFCGKIRIRKVYEPFNVRCCTDCLYARTISSYDLIANHDVSEQILTRDHDDMPFMSVEKYNPYSSVYRYYTMDFYWRKMIERRVLRGNTLSFVRARVQERRERQEYLWKCEEERKAEEARRKKYLRSGKILEFIRELGQEDQDIDHRSPEFKLALARYVDKASAPPSKKAFLVKWQSLSAL